MAALIHSQSQSRSRFVACCVFVLTLLLACAQAVAQELNVSLREQVLMLQKRRSVHQSAGNHCLYAARRRTVSPGGHQPRQGAW